MEKNCIETKCEMKNLFHSLCLFAAVEIKTFLLDFWPFQMLRTGGKTSFCLGGKLVPRAPRLPPLVLSFHALQQEQKTFSLKRDNSKKSAGNILVSVFVFVRKKTKTNNDMMNPKPDIFSWAQLLSKSH